MAPSVGTLRVGRYFGVLVVLLGLLYLVVYFPGNRHTPKLGIDLVGGKRVIFTALSPKGAPPPTSAQMTQARQIIEDRVNGQGVTGATVQVQGGDQLVVLLPGANNADVARLGQAAVLNFRGVVAPAQIVTCTDKATGATGASATSGPSSGATASTAPSANASASGAAPNDAADRPLAAPTSASASGAAASSAGTSSAATSGSGTSGAASGSGAANTPTASPSATQATRCSDDPIAELFKSDPGLRKVIPNAESCPSPALSGPCRAYSSLSAARQQEITGALQNFSCSAGETEPDVASRYYIACDTSGSTSIAYLLGHVVVPGRTISGADAIAPSQSGTGGNTEWTVALNLGGSGADNWNAWTSKFHTAQTNVSPVQTSTTPPCGTGQTAALPCSDFVAFTLGGQVISAPVTNAVLDRQTSISGGFTQQSANALAQELNYGKLPLTFRPDSNQDVSATLGTTQLKAAFLAGGIGLLLVVVYSLLYYRGLGLVTIASLIVSAGLTYAMLVILGNQIGFTLDLAGIAGFIVALGITADSFVVFFERIKDEVHEGRSMRVAVPRAWVRARRTILSADTVSFLAAAILYFFASADVKGFAFTLGLSTILDLIVVFLFTHPIVSLLSRSRAFGSPRFTGLNSVRTGGIVDPVEPEPRRRPARTAAAQQRAASRSGDAQTSTGSVSTRKRSAVAVADDESGDVESDGAEFDNATSPTDTEVEDGTIADDVVVIDDPVAEDEDAHDVDAAESEAAARARRRRGSAPRQQAMGGGSAAERAAARRARQRGGTDEGNTDETGSDDGRES